MGPSALWNDKTATCASPTPTSGLELDTTRIGSAWVVNKPTTDGWVTSLEVYDVAGELIVQFFGVRKPGQPELPAWRALMNRLCATPLAS